MQAFKEGRPSIGMYSLSAECTPQNSSTGRIQRGEGNWILPVLEFWGKNWYLDVEEMRLVYRLATGGGTSLSNKLQQRLDRCKKSSEVVNVFNNKDVQPRTQQDWIVV